MWIFAIFVGFIYFSSSLHDALAAIQMTVTPPVVGIGEPVSIRCSGIRYDKLQYLSIYRLSNSDKNIVRMNEHTATPLFPNSDVIGEDSSVVVESDYLEVKIGRVLCGDGDTYVCSYREELDFEKTEATLAINVKPKLKLTAVPDGKVREGTEVNLECSGLVGYPQRNMTWRVIYPGSASATPSDVIYDVVTFDSDVCSYRSSSTVLIIASTDSDGATFTCLAGDESKSFTLEVFDPNQVAFIIAGVVSGFLVVLGIVAVAIYCFCKRRSQNDWKKREINNSQTTLCTNEVSQISIKNNFERSTLSNPSDSQYKCSVPFTVSRSRIYSNLEKGKTQSDSALETAPRLRVVRHEKQSSMDTMDTLARKYSVQETPIIHAEFRQSREIPPPIQLQKDLSVLPQNIKTPTIDKNQPIRSQFAYPEIRRIDSSYKPRNCDGDIRNVPSQVAYPKSSRIESSYKPRNSDGDIRNVPGHAAHPENSRIDSSSRQNNCDDDVHNFPRSRQHMYQPSGQTIFPDLVSSGYSQEHVPQKKQLNSSRIVSRSQSVSSSIPSQGNTRDPYEPYSVSGLEVESNTDSAFTPTLQNSFSFMTSGSTAPNCPNIPTTRGRRDSPEDQSFSGQCELRSFEHYSDAPQITQPMLGHVAATTNHNRRGTHQSNGLAEFELNEQVSLV